MHSPMVAEAQKKGNERNLKVHRDAKKKCIAMYPCISENHRRVALQTHRDAQYQVEILGALLGRNVARFLC